MNRSRLLVGIAAVFAGLFVFTAVLGFVYNVFLFVVAIPLGMVSYALWYHASGRLRERVRRQSRAAGRTRSRQERATSGFGAGPREEWSRPREGGPDGPGFGNRGRFGGRGRTEGRRKGARGARSRAGSKPSVAEAYAVLGLDPGAGPDRVRAAYRERVKDVHPDAEGGDEAAFKRVQEAYERLEDGRGR